MVEGLLGRAEGEEARVSCSDKKTRITAFDVQPFELYITNLILVNISLISR